MVKTPSYKRTSDGNVQKPHLHSWRQYSTGESARKESKQSSSSSTPAIMSCCKQRRRKGKKTHQQIMQLFFQWWKEKTCTSLLSWKPMCVSDWHFAYRLPNTDFRDRQTDCTLHTRETVKETVHCCENLKKNLLKLPQSVRLWVICWERENHTSLMEFALNSAGWIIYN